MPEIDLVVRGGDWPPREDLAALTRAAIGAAVAAIPDHLPAETAEISILFTNDTEIRALNARFRDKDSATNVLSFPAPPPPAGPVLLGDIVLAEETVTREAVDQGLTREHHISHLLVHGFLHLLGFDHLEDAEATVMEQLEARILAPLGIADPHGQA